MPEIILLTGCFILFVWGLFYAVSSFHDKQRLIRLVLRGIVIILLFASWVFLQNGFFIAVSYAETLFYSSDIFLFKGTLLFAAIIYFILFLKFLKNIRSKSTELASESAVVPLNTSVPYEVPLLMVLSLIGMTFLLSSYDLLMIYISIEMQSLCFYLLVTFRTHSKFATEAGVKYFILGAFASGILLFGISLIYGFTGTTNFSTLQLLWLVDDVMPTSLRVGLLFFLIGFFFKIGLAPFHQWLPDVYEGSPFIVSFFFSLFPKLVYFGLLGRLLLTIFLPLHDLWQPLLQLIAIITLIVGTLGTLYQKKIKRFLAYSTITHAGYLCLGLLVATLEGFHVVYLYLFGYLITIMGIFSLLLMCSYRASGRPLRYLTELAFLRYYHPLLSLGLSMLILSMAGIPFLIGFFLKFALFVVVWSYKFYLEAIIAFFVTIIGAFYYIRVVKIILFEKTPISWKDRQSGPYMCTGILASSFWGAVLSVILFGLIIEVLFVGSWELLTFDEFYFLFFFIKKPRPFKTYNIRSIFHSFGSAISPISKKHYYFSSSSKQNRGMELTLPQENILSGRPYYADTDPFREFVIERDASPVHSPIPRATRPPYEDLVPVDADIFGPLSDQTDSTGVYFPIPDNIDQSNTQVLNSLSGHLSNMFAVSRVVLGLKGFGSFLTTTELNFCLWEPKKDDIRPLAVQFLSLFRTAWGDGINSYLIYSNELIKSTLRLESVSRSCLDFLADRQPPGEGGYGRLDHYQIAKLKQTGVALTQLRHTLVLVATSVALLSGHFAGCGDISLLKTVVNTLMTHGDFPFSIPFNLALPSVTDNLAFFDIPAAVVPDSFVSSPETVAFERWPWRFPMPSTFFFLQDIATEHTDIILTLLSNLPF